MSEIDTKSVNDAQYKSFLKAGAIAALLIVMAGLTEIAISFIPGEGDFSAVPDNVIDYFDLLQKNWFMGIRNLGFINIIMVSLGIPLYYSLFLAHEKNHKLLAGFAMAISFIGAAVFMATNKAFPMLELSNQYAAATSTAQKNIIEAAGKALLATGQSHTPGTFLGFFSGEIAGILISITMLKSKIFGHATAITGLIASSFLLIFEICSSFWLGISNIALVFAIIGGIATMVWYVLTSIRLFKLSKI